MNFNASLWPKSLLTSGGRVKYHRHMYVGICSLVPQMLIVNWVIRSAPIPFDAVHANVPLSFRFILFNCKLFEESGCIVVHDVPFEWMKYESCISNTAGDAIQSNSPVILFHTICGLGSPSAEHFTETSESSVTRTSDGLIVQNGAADHWNDFYDWCLCELCCETHT